MDYVIKLFMVIVLLIGSVGFVQSQDEAIMIQLGNTEGHLFANSDAEFFFLGNAGDRVTIEIAISNGNADMLLELYKPDGSLLFSDDDSGEGFLPLIADLPLSTSGQYRIVVTRCSFCDQSASAAFILSLSGITGGQADATVMPPISPTTVMIDDACEIDAYIVALDEANKAIEEGEIEAILDTMVALLDVIPSTQANCIIEATEDDATNDGENTLIAPIEDGFYLIGIDIMPGRWETTGNGAQCYWARTNVDGDLIDNHFGIAGGTITLLESDFQIEISNCGTAVFVGDRQPVLAPDAFDSKESGFYTVGVEIAPGLWRSTGSGDGCYYARLDDKQEIIANHFGNAGVTINLQPTDYEVEFNDCGTWEYLGEP